MKTPPELIASIMRNVDEFREVSSGAKGAIIGAIESITGKSNRKALFLKLFGTDTSKNLTRGQWYALKRFVNVAEVDGGWYSQVNLSGELRQLVEYYHIEETRLVPHKDGFIREDRLL